jgi:L-lysine 6-oxidase
MSDSKYSYRIHPAIGFARVGNSPDAWYIEPTSVGGLPTELDADGNEQTVTEFKQAGEVKRQAARFRVYRYEDGKRPVEVSPGTGLRSLKWTVHVANKKAAWYGFQELQGDVMLGEDNTYANQDVPLRNAGVQGDSERQRQLIIDPGPRTLEAPGDWVELDASQTDYPHGSFPPTSLTPYPVTTLGAVKMTERGELLVLAGFGNAGGPAGSSINTFAGADGWFDDVGDGPVVAKIETADGQTIELHAWVVSGAPKLAPELVNIASLADTFIDVGVRLMGLCPALHEDGFQPDYVACLERDILPVFRAMKEYRWVANVDAMVSAATPPFDLADLSEANRENRRAVFAKVRNPGAGHQSPERAPQHEQLLGDDGFPLMPLNSGDNSISNVLIEKFMALTPTQYYLLHQWAEGKCVSRRDDPDAGQDWEAWASPLDIAAAGNAVGEPMAPGIEVTWTMRNPAILTPGDPFRPKREGEDYHASGLSPSRDETLAGGGCQPGDLTKRMAIPWQADFFDCSVQDVNFTTPQRNKTISNASRIPLAPTFFAYWWPAQSPYNVYSGASTAAEQALDGNAFLGNNVGQVMGQNLLYHRGLNSFMDSVVGWKYLGFILNTTTGPARDDFPFFVERERSYDAFASGYYGLSPDGLVFTTQPATTMSMQDVNNQSQNVFPMQWLIGN